jgi:hypothetical protein
VKEYDNHELKTVRHGTSPKKVIAAYKHFGSFRKAAESCNINKGTAKLIISRFAPDLLAHAKLPPKASYNVKNVYSKFAKWHKANADNESLTRSLGEMAKLAGVTVDTVKCYFYRRRKSAAKLLRSLPKLQALDLELEDLEGNSFKTKTIAAYHFAIDRYSEKATIIGTRLIGDAETPFIAVILSIELFAKRLKDESSAIAIPRKSKARSS